MAHIVIKDVGPIKDVSFELNKISVFMGPQSSGKSTIAKIVSYCSWFEKNAILHNTKKQDFFKGLIRFHNFEDSYFSKTSRVQYRSELCDIDMYWGDVENSVLEIHIGDGCIFKNRKISYIPAERNFVTIPGLGKYNETRDNILSFMYEWFLAKKELTEADSFSLPVSSLGETLYYYDAESDLDRVKIEDGNTISLNHTSSGLRSCIPMLIVFNYVVNSIYKTKRTKTPFEIIDILDKLKYVNNRLENSDAQKAMAQLMDRFQEYNERKNAVKDTKEGGNSNSDVLLNLQEEFANLLGFYSDYFYSQVIIEEPELNLFPKTQQELVYYMFSVLNNVDREHQLVLTTHSPFILFAINNCVMGGLVGNKIPDNEKDEFASCPAWIAPSLVSIYEIHDGEIQSIQDEDGIIEDNYLNQAYRENSNEYLNMLNYYDNEE